MEKIIVKKSITEPYYQTITITQAGLVAIFISARCQSKKQIQSNVNENLRIEINGLQCKVTSSQKETQFFNSPAAFNGSKLKGLKKTVVFLTILSKGKHVISFIPKNTAFVEEIQIQELCGQQDIVFKIEEQSEDGNTRPWYTFVLVDLPLSQISADITVEKRFRDSDEVKIIVDGNIKRNIKGGKFKHWLITGGILNWLIWRKKGEVKKINITLDESLDDGIHYVEFYADRMPILHQVHFVLKYKETKAEIRAGDIIKNNSTLIKQAAKEFGIDPIMVGGVIYQEQATNVNFIDTLSDYLGGVLHLNTSIGIGQVRVNTAETLEKQYLNLDPNPQDSWFVDYNTVRVERLKDPCTNIRYVAAKIHFHQEMWQKAGFDIQSKPEILGTLYNLDDVSHPIEPHANPTPNEFGQGVKANYDKVKMFLGL